MQHANISLSSLNENLYDISIGAKKQPSRKKFSNYPPRRVELLSSLAGLHEKRPGDYYLAKLSSQSSLNLPKLASKRPNSDMSVSSTDTFKDSDDASLVNSTPFDLPDSRLSSMTANSLYSNRAAEASELEHTKPAFNSIDERSADEECEHMSSSISTLTLKHDGETSNASITELSETRPPILPPKLRSASTSSVLNIKRLASAQRPPHTLQRQASAASSFMLSRSKTRFYNAKETKERKELRKKVYEEFDNDDELLSLDMDFVFNVPVIKNHGELHRTRRNTLSSTMLSRDDIVQVDHSKNPYESSAAIRPCPLPGKLSRSNLSLDKIPQTPGVDSQLSNQSIIEDDESQDSSYFNVDNDGEICQNISEFYSQQSMSYSKLARLSRDQQLTNKLPNYIKSQTSLEDLTLISPEKLEFVDQSRPINLPPKANCDKAKHSKELHRILTGFENTTKTTSNLRKHLGQLFISNQQSWFKLMLSTEEKELELKLHYEREKLRKLSWESLISEKFRFAYFQRMLRLNLGKDFEEKVKAALALYKQKHAALSDQMKATKKAEFSEIVTQVMQRPMFRNFVAEVKEHKDASYDFNLFRENFCYMLSLKSFSDGGVKKHQRIFLIPIFLFLFQSTESFDDIFVLTEMFEVSMFEPEVFTILNKKLSNWKSLSHMSSSSEPFKILSRFTSLQEFESLNAMTFFELIIQLNDRLPLSLSAPSTPIVAQAQFQSLSKVSTDSEGSEKNSSTGSFNSLTDLEPPSIYSKSSSLSLVGIFLQLLLIYSRSKNKNLYHLKLYQSFLLTVFKFYHINWDNCGELVKGNKSIKLNNTSDQMLNLESFVDKWKCIFKKM